MAEPVVPITGASGGTAAALAWRIARDGRQLVLTARRAERLEALARQLERACGIRATAIAADLGAPGAPAALVEEIERRGLEVDWLVNNAGFGTAGRFDH